MAKVLEKEVDKFANAKEQAQAQFDSIKEMVDALQAADQDENDTRGSAADEARDRIKEDALSVAIRSGWYSPGAREDATPEEYEILLCTGGPAVRIRGTLNEHCEPESAKLEMQDWFLPWTEYRPVAGMIGTKNDPRDPERPQYDSEPVLLAYAACFWFGE